MNVTHIWPRKVTGERAERAAIDIDRD